MLVLPLFSASAVLGGSLCTFVSATEPTPAVPAHDPDSWSDVPLETLEDESLRWGYEAGDAEKLSNAKDIKSAASSKVTLYPLENFADSSRYDELGGDIPLEGEMPASKGKTKHSALAQTKRFAAKFVLTAPRKAKLRLLRNGAQSEKDLEECEEKEKKRKKRRWKLELDRLQREQRKKYDSTVELLEQEASRKKIRFKELRKLFRPIKKLLAHSE